MVVLLLGGIVVFVSKNVNACFFVSKDFPVLASHYILYTPRLLPVLDNARSQPAAYGTYGT